LLSSQRPKRNDISIVQVTLSAVLPDASGFQQTVEYQHNRKIRREIFVGRDRNELEKAVNERVDELER
jgi:hypothetical protein